MVLQSLWSASGSGCTQRETTYVSESVDPEHEWAQDRDERRIVGEVLLERVRDLRVEAESACREHLGSVSMCWCTAGDV